MSWGVIMTNHKTPKKSNGWYTTHYLISGGLPKFVMGSKLPVRVCGIKKYYKKHHEWFWQESSPRLRQRQWRWFLRVVLLAIEPKKHVPKFLTRWSATNFIGSFSATDCSDKVSRNSTCQESKRQVFGKVFETYNEIQRTLIWSWGQFSYQNHEWCFVCIYLDLGTSGGVSVVSIWDSVYVRASELFSNKLHAFCQTYLTIFPRGTQESICCVQDTYQTWHQAWAGRVTVGSWRARAARVSARGACQRARHVAATYVCQSLLNFSDVQQIERRKIITLDCWNQFSSTYWVGYMTRI